MKNKVFSLINIISLSIGLSAAFVIGLIVYYEYSFDSFHKDGDRIYRIVSHIENSSDLYKNGGVTAPLRDEAKQMSGIEQAAYFYDWYVQSVRPTDSNIEKRDPEGIILTSSDYFQMFDYNWLAGNVEGVLDAPNEVVLSRKRAKEYFPNLQINEMVGQALIYDGNITTTVRGIVDDHVERSDLRFGEFISLETARNTAMRDKLFTKDWGNTNSASQLFVKVEKGVSKNAIDRQLAHLAKIHTSIYYEEYGVKRSFLLQPLKDVHFNHDYGVFNSIGEQANSSVLKGLAIVALFLLLLGCINFINLSTAQTTIRAKEIGVRKTLGSSRRQLVIQFLSETLVVTIIASLLSILLAIWLLSVFEEFIPDGLTYLEFLEPKIILFLISLIALVALASGLYPSLVLSHFNPATVLSGTKNVAVGHTSLRKFLTVFQFCIAQIFVIATVLVGKQMHYMLSKDLGFESETTAYVSTPRSDSKFSIKEVLYHHIKTIPELEEVSMGGMPPASQSQSSNMVFISREGGEEERLDLEILNVSTNYFDTYKLDLIAGRRRLNDTIREYVINETAVRKFGFGTPQNAVGQNLKMTDGTFPIVGVMKDFNQRSLKTGIEPLAITGDLRRAQHTQFSNIHFSLPTSTQHLSQALKKVENAFKTVYPDHTCDIIFTDQIVANFYRTEKRVSTLLNWVTGLSILISCLGLIGLVIHTTERRTKEIGIRKVLGASLTQLNVLLCKEFLLLVLIAFAIAVPIAYLGLSDWLQNYAYRTEVSWWVFVLSGLAMVVIAVIIMSIRTMSTAIKNPVHSLKTE